MHPSRQHEIYATSLTKYFSEIFIILLVQMAAHLPDEASRCLSVLTIVTPEVHIMTQNKLCPCGRWKDKAYRGKFTECVVEYKNKPRGKG